MPELVCAFCENNFFVSNSKAENGRRFCSRNCYWNSMKNWPREKFVAMRKKSPGFRGPHSEETKARISAALKGRPNPAFAVIGRAQIGPKHPRWMGDDATPHTGRRRAQTLYPIPKRCERCGALPDEVRMIRHHIDRNTLNNEIENIEWLCPRCHIREHRKCVQ